MSTATTTINTKSNAQSKVKKRISKLCRQIFLLICSVIFLYPMYWMVALSFKTEAEASARPFSLPTQFNLDNYRAVMERIDILPGMWNSFMYSIVVAVLGGIVTTLGAYAIFRMRKKSSSAVHSYLLLGLAVPGMCLVVPVYLILKQIGLIGTFWAVIIPCVTGQVAGGVLLVGAFTKSLPYELEEAAAIDGCGCFRGFLQIIMPMLMPVITTRFVLTFLSMWNNYETFKFFCLGSARQPITLMTARFFIADRAVHWGNVGAAIVITSLPAIVLYCTFNKQLSNALTVGSLSK